MTIKAIETQYAGCRFRSRTEARWAVCFDHLGVEWQYEPQGYELPDGLYYLPDFWLPEMEVHAEVKGTIDEESAQKIVHISRNLPPGSYPTLVLGDIPKEGSCGPHMVAVRPSYRPNKIEFHQMSLMIMDSDMVATVPFGWAKHRSIDPYVYDLTDWEVVSAGFVMDQWPVKEAYAAARSARFEHGEYPVPPPTFGPRAHRGGRG